jgi:predicted dehydrogenase
MIDAAIIGLGWWGRCLTEALQGKSKSIRFVRGVDVAPEGVVGFAAEKGFALSADYRDALGDPAVRAVVLATPHAFHADQVVAAARAGKHVFVEKPLALTKADAARAAAACDEAGVVLGIGHERRFEPALIEVARMVKAGELGTIMHAEASFSHDSLAGLPADNWRVSPEHAPAAGMTAMGIHLTDSLIGMLGPVARVWAQTTRRVVAAAGGDVVSAHLTFESGATGYINSILATPFFMEIRVFGSDAWVVVRDTVRPEAEGVAYLTVRRAGGAPETREFASIEAARVNLEAFAEAAAGGAPYPIPRAEMIHNIAVLEAIAASAASGEATPVA